MSLLGCKDIVPEAFPDDFPREEGEKEVSNEKFYSIQDIFGLESVDCNIRFDSYVNFSFVVMKISSEKNGGGFPSVIHIGNVRINSLIKALKEYGTVQVVFSATFYSGIGTKFILEVIPAEGKSLFLLVSDIDSVGPKNYPEFVDDIVKVPSYSYYTEETIDAGEILYSKLISLYYDVTSYKQATEIASKINEVGLIEFKDTEETYVEMIIQSNSGLTTKKILFSHEYDDKDLDLHYGEGFSKFHNALIDRIKARNKGITMFHGPPGTGKTHYIRRLLPELSKAGKRVILIPKHVLGALESPGFNEFMLRNFIGEKIVFIIEDSESIISKRAAAGEHRSELISTLLNVTDGILNDIFSIQVILTFNTNLESIDDALQRKGRLTAKYKFNLLDRADAIKLAKYLGVEITSDASAFTLADIYALREIKKDDILINQRYNKSVVGF